MLAKGRRASGISSAVVWSSHAASLSIFSHRELMDISFNPRDTIFPTFIEDSKLVYAHQGYKKALRAQSIDRLLIEV
jgi:hypothetical protein